MFVAKSSLTALFVLAACVTAVESASNAGEASQPNADARPRPSLAAGKDCGGGHAVGSGSSSIANGPIDIAKYPYNIELYGTTGPIVQMFPAFTSVSLGGTYANRSGPNHITGTDGTGTILFIQPFDAVADDENVSRFVFVLPISAATYERLATLTVTANGKCASISGSSAEPPSATAVRLPSGKIALTWNGDRYPAAIVVAPDGTTPIYATSETGLSTATIVSTAVTLSIEFTNNVKSTIVNVPVR